MRRWRALASALCVTAALVASTGALAASPLPPQKTAVLFGAKIRYFEMGSGPTVVLVHGLGSSARGDWGTVMQSLGASHHVLALDLLGFGASDKPFITYGIQTWVDFLGEFLRDRKVASFTLMGESLGGWIAAQYTIQALAEQAVGPKYLLPKPSKLVLCDAAGFSKATVTQMVDRSASSTMPSGMSLAGQQRLLGAVFHDPAWSSDKGLRTGMAWAISKGDGWTIQSLLSNRSIIEEATQERLGSITIPTLVVWGQYDQLVPIADGEGYAVAIPGARLVVIPDVGHAPMIEAPALFLKAVGTFL